MNVRWSCIFARVTAGLLKAGAERLERARLLRLNRKLIAGADARYKLLGIASDANLGRIGGIADKLRVIDIEFRRQFPRPIVFAGPFKPRRNQAAFGLVGCIETSSLSSLRGEEI